MNYWRMSFRVGNRGYEMWPDCFTRGIAAIAYYYKDPGGEWKPVVEDCSKITESEFVNLWRKRRPKSGSAQPSLKNVAYRMKKGDIIYVKQGPNIVGKGVITKEYQYDPNILKGSKEKWEHFVTVEWEKEFSDFNLFLGAEQNAVLKLNDERLSKILKHESEARAEKIIQELPLSNQDSSSDEKLKIIEAEEGGSYIREAAFRYRNRELIEEKKSHSDYRCEVCKMKFAEVYGKIGEKYIIAHHKKPIGGRGEASKTKLEEIALVCPNCHSMLHMSDPPFTIQELSKMLKVKNPNV